MTRSGHEVRLVCVTVGLLVSAWGHYIPQTRSDGQAVPLSNFKLTRITQQPTGQGSMVQLFFEGSQLPRVAIEAGDYTVQPQELQMGSDGSVEFYRPDGYVDMHFLHPQGYQYLKLFISENNPPETRVPDAEIFIKGGKEVTFENGNDADVNVTFTVDSRDATIRLGYFDFGFLAKSNTEDHVVESFYGSSETPYTILNEGESERERFVHIRLNTSSGDLEGLLEIDASVGSDCSGGESSCLDFFYLIHEDVPVYRKDHDGPFADHYVGLLKYQYDPNLPKQICSFHDPMPCHLRCEFIGDHPTPVEFVRVAGQVEEPRLLSESNDGYRSVGLLTFANVTANGVEVEYECSSRSGPEVTSHTARIMFVHDPRVRYDLSSVSRPDEETVVATCVAEGSPPPTLTFYDSHDTLLDDVSENSYEIVVTTPDNSTSKGVIRITDPAVANRLRYVTCMAVNEIGGMRFNASIDLHVSQSSTSQLSPEVRYYLENIVVGQ